MERPCLAVVIPAYNECATVGRIVREVSRFGTVIVVDDASDDGTGDASLAAGAVVIRNKSNQGYDSSLNAGFRHAATLGVNYVVTFDADGQHDPESIEAVVRELSDGNDIVIGVRPRKARITESLFALLMRWRYGIRDPLCGLKGYRMALYHQQGHFDSRGSVGTELMFFGLRRGFRFSQVEIPVFARDGNPRFGHSFRGNWKIMRAMVSMIRA